MRVTAGRKPRSAMWSASSSTVISTSARVHGAPLDQVDQPAGGRDDDVDAAARARRSGGRSGRRRRRRRCARRARRPSGDQRVGDLLGELAGRHEHQAARALGVPRPSAPARRVSIGRPKASVLPEPVCARPSTSRPASASGRARAWMANGVVDAAAGQRGRPAGRAGRARRKVVGSGCGTASAAVSARSSSVAWSSRRTASRLSRRTAGPFLAASPPRRRGGLPRRREPGAARPESAAPRRGVTA